MKALVCEMCGSQDLVKTDGMYVCQNCGTKYTVEEAKKMMVEGTVKIDNSAFVEKYLANARRAKEKEDWEEVEKYYNMVEQNDPKNIEAIFYSAYGKAKTSLTNNDIYKRQAVFKVLQNCVSVIDDNYSIEKEKEERSIIEQITADIMKMACSNFVYTEWKNGYGEVTKTDKYETLKLFNNLIGEWLGSLENIVAKYPQNEIVRVEYIYYLIIRLEEFTRDQWGWMNAKIINDCNKTIVTFHQKIKDIHPEHEVPVFEEMQQSTSSGGCYVATCVYGSYDCPQVWTLRRFRDNTLAETWYGRAFIHVYYAVSPTLVKWFGHTSWFKKLWKGKLDHMVANLNADGVEDTPYNDKVW